MLFEASSVAFQMKRLKIQILQFVCVNPSNIYCFFFQEKAEFCTVFFMMAELQLDLNQSLELRIAQFKNDPEKVKVVNEFLNETFEKAQKEVEKRAGKQKSKLVKRIVKFFYEPHETVVYFLGSIRNPE